MKVTFTEGDLMQNPFSSGNKKCLQQKIIPVGCVPPASSGVPLDVSTGGCTGPHVNKLEHVSSDDHQMSIAGVGYLGGRVSWQ